MSANAASLTVKRDVLMLAGLLVVSYGGLLWLTADEHRAAAKDSVSHAAPMLPTTQGAELRETQLPTPQLVNEVQFDDLDSIANTEGSSKESAGSMSADPQASMQRVISEQEDALLRRASPSDPLAIHTLSQALQPGNDRETRLAAVSALLMMGRKSLVDPAVTEALKQAVNDTDSAVSARANSALAEVERATH